MSKKISIIKGDGIGIEVMDASLLILDKMDLNLKYKFLEAGNACYEKNGTTIPEETIKKSKKSDAILFGAVTTVEGNKSAIITLRKELDLYANIRPITSLPGIKSIYNDLNFTIIRENSEGLYSGLETETENGAEAKRIITKTASERICDFAFNYAKNNSFNKVTAVHKANVLKKTDGIFKESFYKVAKNYSHMKSEDYYVDATAMYLITQPQKFEVIVTSNLFGDILSDESAGLVGGLGLAPSANIGKNNGLFEPVHGSAPDISGKQISNPTAMILSTIMMLNYINQAEDAQQLENALMDTLKEKKYLTPDLGGSSKTHEMAKAISSKIE